LRLARIASSGDVVFRGGDNHSPIRFVIQCCFLFGSILVPPLTPQDRSRLAILELLRLEDKPRKKGERLEPPDLAKRGLPAIGEALLRRMVDGIERLEATKAKYHAALADVGHGPRACDQFGTLLACADVLLHDHALPDDEEVGHFAAMCRPDRMAEIADEVPDHLECLHHIRTSEVQARGGDEREALGSWIGAAVAHAMAPLLAADDPRKGDERADRRLQQLGLKLVNPRWKAGKDGKPGGFGAVSFSHEEPGFLAIANKHQGLERIFNGQKWQAGGWRQSLGRCEGSIENVDVKFVHYKSRAVLVPLWQVIDEEELPNASRREAVEAWRAECEKGAEA
jgi:hypothetical protein